jgi:uncharacterized protein DUF1579
MNRNGLSNVIALVGAALLVTVPLAPRAIASPDTKPAANQGPSSDTEAMMKEYLKFAQPGPNHKLLESCAGRWDLVARMWMGPGAPATESKGTAERKMVLGGRYVAEELQGQMLGHPFSGMGLTGYDNFKKMYTWVWADSMSTAIMSSLGTPDESGKVITFTGEMDEPLTGEKGKKVKSVLRLEGPDKQIFEMYDHLPDGTEWKALEVTYTRKK